MDDVTIVLCNCDGNLDPQLLKLLNYETRNYILEVKDPGLAEVLFMEPGMIYFYYKPSIINGLNEAMIDEFVNVELA